MHEVVESTGAPSADLLAELDAAAEALEGSDALAIIAWAAEHFPGELVVASSFQDAVLVDLAVRVDPRLPILFLDTGFHFPETLAYLHRVERQFDINLEIASPTVGLDVSPCGSPDCCQVRKVEPLERALGSRRAWVTGLKRVDTPERTAAPVIGWDAGRGVVKVNPIAAWTDEDVDRYVAEHDLPSHPLAAVGYRSIGCAPTTRPVAEGEDPRAGRWSDSTKTECGLHL